MMVPLSIKNSDIKIDVSEFKGEKRIDIRKWYQDKESGEWKRTQKGINLSLEEWNQFKNQIDDIFSYVEEEIDK